MIWFTSDTHFGHANIIKYCKRPFNSVAHMNEALIANWNEVVDPRDTVYHLGDFAMRTDAGPILRRLNGFKHLILGNHDNRKEMRNETAWVSVHDYLELRLNDYPLIVLAHYAHRVWNKAHHGSYHLYGHSHGGLPGVGRSMDVGTDPMKYYPISITDVDKILSKKEKVEHHGED